MEKIKARFVDLAGKKFTKTFSGSSFTSAYAKMEQFAEDRKDVIFIGWWGV